MHTTRSLTTCRNVMGGGTHGRGACMARGAMRGGEKACVAGGRGPVWQGGGSVHGGDLYGGGAVFMAEGAMHGRGCVAGGVHGREHALQGGACMAGVCMAGGHAWQGGACMAGRGMHGEGHACMALHAQPPPWTEWQTRVKTLPCRNFVAGGNNKIFYEKPDPLLNHWYHF